MARQLIHTRWSFNISLYVSSIFLLTFMLQSCGEYDLWDLSQEHFLDQNTWRSTKFVNKLSLSGTEQPASYSLTICSPKNIIFAIIYSPSWYSKPVYVSFLCWTKIFSRNLKNQKIVCPHWLSDFHSRDRNTMEVNGDHQVFDSAFFKIYYFMFNIRKKPKQVWNTMRGSKWGGGGGAIPLTRQWGFNTLKLSNFHFKHNFNAVI